MITIDTSKVEPRVSDLLNQLKQDGNSVIIEQNGKAIATLIDYQEWERLKQLETQIMEREREKEYYTVEEIIDSYNAQHGTFFSKKNIKDKS
jgi:prevent-host-death family protein